MDYLRLKQFNIAYNLPENTLKSVGVKGARIYLMGTNLLTSLSSSYGIRKYIPVMEQLIRMIMSCSLGVNFSF